jgi:hypothetical protein
MDGAKKLHKEICGIFSKIPGLYDRLNSHENYRAHMEGSDSYWIEDIKLLRGKLKNYLSGLASRKP